MKTQLMMIGALAAACTVHELAAMPTAEEARRAEPVVQKLLKSEREALKSGRKSRSEVAAAAMELAGETDTEAAKLLLMKGAFALYVQDGNLEKAAETMNAIKKAIPDLPQESVKNMIEMALIGVPKKEDGSLLYRLLDEAKVDIASMKSVTQLFPGWSLLSSEVKPEFVSHRGQDRVLRMHPKDQKTPVVLKRTMKLSDKNPCLFLKVASFDGGSDFVLSVRVNGKNVMPDRIVCTSDLEPWEDLVVPLFDWRGHLAEIEIVTKANGWWCEWSHFARIEIAEGNGQETCGLVGVKNGTETVDGYTWSYFVKNGEATVTAAVSPRPKGAITIPATLGGVKVTGLGKNLFDHCKEVTSVTVPKGVTSIGQGAFNFCYGLKSVTIPSSVKTIGDWAFSACFQLQSVTLPESLEYIGKGGFINCRSLKTVNIPAKLSVIGDSAFAYCTGLKQFTVDVDNKAFTAIDGVVYSKDWSTLVSAPNVSTIARMPPSMTKIGANAFQGCDRLETLTIPENVTMIDCGAFHSCERLASMTIPASVAKIGPNAFDNCGELTEVTMLGERPEAPNAIFNKNCGKLKAIYVPANAKSWAGMKDWFGVPLVFDGEVSKAFSLNAAPGSITEIDLGNVPPLQFVYCPAGKFSMGYKDQPALSKVKDVEITSPFWVSKTPIRADQLEFMGLNSNTNAETDDAVINDGSIVLEKLPSALKERFGKMLPPGYVFRLPTEAEFEYLHKSETKDKDASANIWGVERLYSGGLIGVLDRAPAYGRVDVVRKRNSRGVILTALEKVNYENQPDKDPVGWSDDPNWSVFRRGLARNCGGGKLVTAPGGSKYNYIFYFVVAPDIDKLNKFYWK